MLARFVKEPIFGGVDARLTHHFDHRLTAIERLCIHVYLPGLNAYPSKTNSV